MGRDEPISSKHDLKLRSITELYDAKFRPGLLDGQHYCFVRVFRFRSEIYKSGTFAFGVLPLRNVLYLLSLRFKEAPSILQFSLYVYGSSDSNSIVTTTPLNGILNSKFNKGFLTVSPKDSGALLLVIRSVTAAVADYRKKTIVGPVSKPQSLKTPRASPEQKDVTTFYKTVNILDGSVASNIAGTYKVLYRSYVGVRTPNFKALARTGQLPVNNYSMSRVIMAKGSYYHLYQYLYKPTKTTAGTIETANFPPHLIWTDLPSGHLTVNENIVISRLQNQIQGSNANLGEDAATIGMTLRLVTKNVMRLRTLANYLRGGNIQAYFRALGDARGANSFIKSFRQAERAGLSGSTLLAELWLEYRYGWIPLLSDIEGSLNAYARYVARNPRVLTVTATATNSSISETYVSNISVITPGKRAAVKLSHTKTQCKIGLHYHVSAPVKALFSQLGLTSPIALGWELIPFSFVVDWFLPIGTALSAASAFDGLTFNSGYKRYRTETRTQIDYELSDADSDATYNRTEKISGTGTGTRINVTRTKLTSFPSAVVPIVKNPYSPIHAANAVALLIVALSRR